VHLDRREWRLHVEELPTEPPVNLQELDVFFAQRARALPQATVPWGQRPQERCIRMSGAPNA